MKSGNLYSLCSFPSTTLQPGKPVSASLSSEPENFLIRTLCGEFTLLGCGVRQFTYEDCHPDAGSVAGFCVGRDSDSSTRNRREHSHFQRGSSGYPGPFAVPSGGSTGLGTREQSGTEARDVGVVS